MGSRDLYHRGNWMSGQRIYMYWVFLVAGLGGGCDLSFILASSCVCI